MARKIKRPKPPPLSVIDKIIYALLILSGFAWILFSFFLFENCQSIAAHAEIAMRMWQNPLWLCIAPAVLSGTVPAWIACVWIPMPLFGKRGVPYGQYPYHEYAPIFSRSRPLKTARPEIWRRKWRGTLILLAVGIISIALCVPGIFARYSLDADYSVRHYNVFNQCDDHIAAEDVAALHIVARHGHYQRGPEFWDYYLIVDTDNGKCCELHSFCIRDDDFEDNLRFLLNYRDAVNAPILIEAEDRMAVWEKAEREPWTVEELLPMIVKDRRLNEKEAQLLYQLFEAP